MKVRENELEGTSETANKKEKRKKKKERKIQKKRKGWRDENKRVGMEESRKGGGRGVI